MLTKFSKVLVLVLVLSVGFTGVAYAEEDTPESRLRAAGEITSVDPSSGTFSLHTRAGEDLRFHTDATTQYRSPDGSVQGIEDLTAGMHAAVVAVGSEAGMLAKWVVAASEPVERLQAAGTIVGVSSAQGSFSLEKRDGDVLVFQTGDRTRWHSRDGSIGGIEDLQAGMLAGVLAIVQPNGSLYALRVAVAQPEDVPELRRYSGEIAGVVPGQGTFELTTEQGSTLSFMTTERTRFFSRDGSVQDIHDLKKGMRAQVAAFTNDAGQLQAAAVYVAVAERPEIDVRAAGRIVALGQNSFTLETFGGSTMTFKVDGTTMYKSRGGGVNGFEDLEVGMSAAVGAVKLGDDQLKAVWVGVANPTTERPARAPDAGLDEPPLEAGPPLRDNGEGAADL